MDRYRMIRDYFDRLMHEVAEHPDWLGEADTDVAKRMKRNHESAQRDAIGRMKQFASWFTHGVPGGATLRREIFEAKRGAQVIDKIEVFFTQRANEAQSDAIEEHDEELEAAPAAWG
jgi:tRNA-dihydrouridine synthase B